MTHIKVKTPVYVPSFFNLMDKFMTDELNAVSAKQPAVNIIEKDQQYELVMMAPGLSKSDFTISLEKEYLTISYTKSATNEEETPKFIKKEPIPKESDEHGDNDRDDDCEPVCFSFHNKLIFVLKKGERWGEFKNKLFYKLPFRPKIFQLYALSLAFVIRFVFVKCLTQHFPQCLVVGFVENRFVKKVKFGQQLDIEEFLELRKNTGDDRGRTHDMNTAVWVPDLFMQRVIEGAEHPQEAGRGQWTLFSPSTCPDLHDKTGRDFEQAYSAYEAEVDRGAIKLFKRMPAKDLWRKMLTMLYETGHPWITFKEACNLRSPQQHAGVVHSSNLCTEITLNTGPDEIAV